jgi:predicted transcriptional regulator
MPETVVSNTVCACADAGARSIRDPRSRQVVMMPACIEAVLMNESAERILWIARLLGGESFAGVGDHMTHEPVAAISLSWKAPPQG